MQTLLFLWLLCAATEAIVVKSAFTSNQQATFLDNVTVQGTTTIKDADVHGTLDMHFNPVINAAPVAPVLISTTSIVPLNTGATVYILNPSAGSIVVTLTDMPMYTVLRFVMDGHTDTNTVLLDFTTDSFAMNQPGSCLALILINSGITVLDQCLTVDVNASVRARLADPVPGLFGYPEQLALSADGHTLVVGSNNDNNAYGIAFVFTRVGTTWSYVQNLTASNGVQFDTFGSAVAVNADGTTIMAGAPGRNGYRGAAYVFILSGTWTEQAMLVAIDAYPSLAFGAVLAVSATGDQAIVGSQDFSGTGSAYTFSRSGGTWSYGATLTAEADAKPQDAFGQDVDISGDGATAIVGSRDNSPGSPNRKAYVFVDSGGWARQQKIDQPPWAVNVTNFAEKVAISSNGNTIGITSVGLDPTGNGVYMYTRSGSVWTYAMRLPTAEVPAGHIMGSNIMLSQDAGTAVMASYWWGAPPNTGRAYVYARSGATWAYVRSIQLDPAENTHNFAVRGDMSDDGLTMALTSQALFSQGYVYVFMRE